MNALLKSSGEVKKKTKKAKKRGGGLCIQLRTLWGCGCREYTKFYVPAVEYIYDRQEEQSQSQEHHCHLRLGNTDKSAIAQHTGHAIWFDNITVLHRFSSWRERVIKEPMEISLAGKSILNQEEGAV